MTRAPLQLFICEFCLKFFKMKSELLWHTRKCKLRVSVKCNQTDRSWNVFPRGHFSPYRKHRGAQARG